MVILIMVFMVEALVDNSKKRYLSNECVVLVLVREGMKLITDKGGHLRTIVRDIHMYEDKVRQGGPSESVGEGYIYGIRLGQVRLGQGVHL